MAKRVSFKVAPGVRISASSRGVRTSIGNNRARVSFGGGRTYTSAKVAGVRMSHTSSAPARRPQTATAPRPTLAQLERIALAEEVMLFEARLTSVHLEHFPAAQPFHVEAPAPVLPTDLEPGLRKQALSDVGLFQRSQRRAAKERARVEAEQEADRINAENAAIYRQFSDDAERAWRQLLDHEPTSVIQMIDHAFADNAAPSTCVDAGREDDGTCYATVVILFGPPSLIPERTSAFTPTGRQTLKKRTKTDRNDLYLRALGSTVLATVREALQLSPASDQIRVIVLRQEALTTASTHRVAPIYAASFSRRQIGQLQLDRVRLGEFLLNQDDARIRRKGVALDVIPLDVSQDDDLARLTAEFARALS